MDKFETLKNKIKESLKEVTSTECALAFSGGIDSTVLALIMREMNINFESYTAGVKNCYDHSRAQMVAERLGIPVNIIEVEKDEIARAYDDIKRITGTDSILEISFRMPLYFVLESCREEHVVTGQGADELFGGYAKYVNLTYDETQKMMDSDLNKLIEYGIVHDMKMAENFGKKLHAPYLHDDVVREAKNIPITRKIIKGNEIIRKFPLRVIAESFGVDEDIVHAKKKAGQYGGGFMKILKKLKI